MAFYPTIDHERKRTSCYFLEQMTAREFADCAVTCREAGSLPYTHLIVVSGATVTVQQMDILWLSKRIKEIAGPTPIGAIAFVADGVRDFGLLRMLASMVSDVCQMSVHHSYREAIMQLNWKTLAATDSQAATCP